MANIHVFNPNIPFIIGVNGIDNKLNENNFNDIF